MEKNTETLSEELGGVSLSPAATSQLSIDQPDGASTASGASQGQSNKKSPRCRFYNTKKGCRAGASCPFRHEILQTDATAVAQDKEKPTAPLNNAKASNNPDAKPIQKPEPVDARTFQINQIRRRFRPKEENLENGTTVLYFGMTPSDPDFPFDISALECSLRIPATFPEESKAILRITNKEMERGFQINVEQGFDEIWRQASNPTLLNALKVLDKRLEELLTAQKAEIVKLIANSGSSAPVAPKEAKTPSTETESTTPTPAHVSTQAAPAKAVENKIAVSRERIAQARSIRENETQQLEHRLGRDPKFSKSNANNGDFFNIPIEPRKRDALPLSIQAVKSLRLFVPLEYNIEPPRIELIGVEGEAVDAICKAFVALGLKQPEMSLLARVNYLAQNMHVMAKQIPPEKPAFVETPPQVKVEDFAPQENVDGRAREPEGAIATEQEHLKIIPRPPEWDAKPRRDGDGEDTTDGYDSEYDSSEEDESDNGDDAHTEETTTTQSSSTREKGILISFPGLELHGIELLELVLINATIKCERCKDTMDVQRLKPQAEDTPSNTSTTEAQAILSTSCKKCASPFSLGYRKDIMHVNSARAGYLDLEGCTIVDLLPSTFVPTCGECSTPALAGPSNTGVTAVRGESTLTICRTCHRKLTFRIPEVKFLHVGGAGTGRLPLKPTRKAPKEALGIVAGTPLPDRGRCRHYSKSYRWFRFSCCGKVFPCDKCHDKAADHPNEFANRMLCGWCSREQHYRPEDCGFAGCRKNVTGRTGSGFWEGGKGTRDRARMSRKDPRKFKRRGGGALAAKN